MNRRVGAILSKWYKVEMIRLCRTGDQNVQGDKNVQSEHESGGNIEQMVQGEDDQIVQPVQSEQDQIVQDEQDIEANSDQTVQNMMGNEEWAKGEQHVRGVQGEQVENYEVEI